MLGHDYNLKYQTRNGYDIIYKKVVLTLDKIDVFKQMIQNAKRIVFFGGAGVSTESGIPDFRSEDGLYRLKYPYSPEEILSNLVKIIRNIICIWITKRITVNTEAYSLTQEILLIWKTQVQKA